MSQPARRIAPAPLPSRRLVSIALMVAVLLGLWPRAARLQPLSQTGDWHASGDLGVIGTHVAVLKDPITFSTKVYLMGGFGSGHQHRLWQLVPSAALTIPDPLSNFLNPGLPPPPPDPSPPPEQELPTGFVDTFCSGHVVLPNGHLLLVGGEYSTPYGTELTYTLDPSWSGAGSAWTRQATMAQERWYPAVTTLARGEALVTAGNKHAYMMTFGGLEEAGPPSSGLYPLAIAGRSYWSSGELLGGISPPSGREGHTIAWENDASYPVLFGGDTNGPGPGGKVASVHILEHRFETDTTWAWYQYAIPPATPIPAARSRHTAVVRPGNRMIVFGGLNDAGDALGDLWEGTRVTFQGADHWQWTDLNLPGAVTGTPPSARYGHTAIYDPGPPIAGGTARILIWGGRDENGLSDTDVHVLELTATPNWQHFAIAGAPSAREGHAAVFDRKERGPSGAHWRRMILFGGQTAADVQNDTWELWRNDILPITYQWRLIQPAAGSPLPSARTRHTVVHDVQWDRLTVFGGDTTATDETSGFTSTLWRLPLPEFVERRWGVPPARPGGHPSPLPRAGHAAFHEGRPIRARYPERFLFSASSGALPGSWEVINQPLNQQLYPFMFLLPYGDGNLFYAGPEDELHQYLLNLTTGWSPQTFPTYNEPGSAVQYRPGKFMRCGMHSESDGAPGRPDTERITVNPDLTLTPTAGWERVGDMLARANHNLVMLPTGKVLVTGGLKGTDLSDPERRPQVWDPGTASWTAPNVLEPDPIRRSYHSAAILLPDARVLSTGGEGPLPEIERRTATIYEPPYLFTGNAYATRPLITNSSALSASIVTYGQAFVVNTNTAGSITRICLIRPGAVTHGFNQDQVYMELTFEPLPDYSGLRVLAPDRGAAAPPGDYYLFISAGDVPSVATWIRLGDCATVPCDTDPPPKLTGFYADIVGPNEIWFVWTAPGDVSVPGLGVSGQYDLRFSTSPITGENAYATATEVPVPPNGAPDDAEEPNAAPAGTPITYTKYDLAPCTQYHFALKTRDGIPPANLKNWSVRSESLAVTTTCGGWGGGGGYSAHRVDGEREAGGLGISPASGRGPAPITGGENERAEIAGLSSSELVAGVLEAETRRAPQGGWQVTVRLLAQADDLEPADEGSIVSQVQTDAGGWRTLGRFRPTPGQSPLGLGALRDKGRIVFPAGYRLERVVTDLRWDGQNHSLNQAHHSRLGDLSSVFLAGAESVDLRLGDAFTMRYAPSTTGPSSATSTYLLVRPGTVSAVPAGRRAFASATPTRFALHTSQPNPSRGSSAIRFDLPKLTTVRLEVFDLQGRLVRTLATGPHEPGEHAVQWNGKDDSGSPLPAGVYQCRIQAGEFRARKSVVLLP